MESLVLNKEDPVRLVVKHTFLEFETGGHAPPEDDAAQRRKSDSSVGKVANRLGDESQGPSSLTTSFLNEERSKEEDFDRQGHPDSAAQPDSSAQQSCNTGGPPPPLYGSRRSSACSEENNDVLGRGSMMSIVTNNGFDNAQDLSTWARGQVARRSACSNGRDSRLSIGSVRDEEDMRQFPSYKTDYWGDEAQELWSAGAGVPYTAARWNDAASRVPPNVMPPHVPPHHGGRMGAVPARPPGQLDVPLMPGTAPPGAWGGPPHFYPSLPAMLPSPMSPLSWAPPAGGGYCYPGVMGWQGPPPLPAHVALGGKPSPAHRGQHAPATTTHHMYKHAAKRTTVMLRNMPEGYRRDDLAAILDRHGFLGAYDFVYMPMNFRTQASFGYAFVNLVSQEQAQRCHDQFQGFREWGVHTDKICEVSWSDMHQGLGAHIERYRNSPVMHESVPDEYKPVMYSMGKRAVFPVPTKKLRQPRIRKSTEDGYDDGDNDVEDSPAQHGAGGCFGSTPPR